MTGRFEHVDHTADLLVRAEGATLAEAFEQAALGMFAHIADPSQVRTTGTFELRLEAATPEELLYRFLEELRFASETRLLLFARFEVELAEGAPWRLVARAHGEAYDEPRHGHIHEVKAVTMHALRVRREPPLVEVVVDI